jgi:hypothetical protein
MTPVLASLWVVSHVKGERDVLAQGSDLCVG